MPQYIKLNLVQTLLEEVKEKEYFVAHKVPGDQRFDNWYVHQNKIANLPELLMIVI